MAHEIHCNISHQPKRSLRQKNFFEHELNKISNCKSTHHENINILLVVVAYLFVALYLAINIIFNFIFSQYIIMGNPWMDHVKTVSAANKGKGLKEILKMAKKTYKRSPGVHKKAHKKAHKKHTRKTRKKRRHKKRRKTRRKTRKRRRRR
jgi:hypothetical protein